MGINWAILGTGVVANEMAVALSSAGKEIYAVGNRTHSKALDFAKKYDMNNRFFNRNLAGGAMLDIGVYALSFVRWFMDSKPNEIISQVKYAPTGVDEQATILLKNESEQMATVALTLHSKHPKRGMISLDKAYIEIMEYPRATTAVITYTEDGSTETISVGDTKEALKYEMEDVEKAINGDNSGVFLEYTKDVMDMMTEIRKQWNMTYPEEE